MKLKYLIFCGFLATSAFARPSNPDSLLPWGTYTGTFKVDGSSDAIAATLEFYNYMREGDAGAHDVMLLKFGLGGFLSPEYETEMFETFRFDIDNLFVDLNDPHNEVRAQLHILDNPKRLEGQFYQKSSAKRGTVYLELQPTPQKKTFHAKEKLMPTLSGQYEGKCGNDDAVLQIETGKGLTNEVPIPTAGLRHYNITGAFGVTNGVCPRVNAPDRPSWCVVHAYSSGVYDFFQGSLSLKGTLSTDECTRDGENLNCNITYPSGGVSSEKSCKLHKTNSSASDFKVYPRQFHVVATPDQKKILPLLNPPLNKELLDAAGGSFYGYLHNQYLDRYQPLRWDVTATSTTDNMHREQRVFVSTTSVLSFGDGSRTSWPQQFDERLLLIGAGKPGEPVALGFIWPGFNLRSDDTDSFLQVTEWDNGYIEGDWYSSHFGYAGTFELVKADHFPPIDSSAKLMTDVAGRFQGPGEMSNGGKDYWDLKTSVPKQPRSDEMSYLVFQGNYLLFAGGFAQPSPQKIDWGAYDIYSGSLSWLTSDYSGGDGEQKLVTGFVDGIDSLKIYWPVERQPVATGIRDRVFGTYTRVK